MHHGVKGMKWGVRKDYKPTSLRAAFARRSNEKVDQSFKKWNTESAKKADAISLGKKANASRMAYEADRSNKEAKKQFKADNKEYKQALRKNTEYRKGTIRKEVGQDLSRKYMSAAKKAKKSDDMKSYQDLMNKHDIERAKARKAQAVGQRRSNFKAGLKRTAKMSIKAAVATAAITYGLAYAQKKGYNVSMADVQTISKYAKTGQKFMSYMY